MKFKGPKFPSFFNQGTPEPRQQWVAHQGRRARLRQLRRGCKEILDNKLNEPMIQRIREKVPPGPFSEYGVLMIIFQSKEVSDSTGMSWLECADYTLEHLKIEEPTKETQNAK